MKHKEFYQQLATLEERELLTLHPGPLTLVGTPADALAAKLILWLFDELPPEATQGDLEEVLEVATWWVRFFAMLRGGDRWREREAAAVAPDTAIGPAGDIAETREAPDGSTAETREGARATPPRSDDAAGGTASSGEGRSSDGL